jgi:hypothetical protein
MLTMLYQLSHLWANIRIHFHGNTWPTFVRTFQCLLTHTAFRTYDTSFRPSFSWSAVLTKLQHHHMYCTDLPSSNLLSHFNYHATWPTLIALCPLLASILFYYCLLFLAMLWDAQFSEVFHELQRASSNLDRKWVRASFSDISITLQRTA